MQEKELFRVFPDRKVDHIDGDRHDYADNGVQRAVKDILQGIVQHRIRDDDAEVHDGCQSRAGRYLQHYAGIQCQQHAQGHNEIDGHHMGGDPRQCLHEEKEQESPDASHDRTDDTVEGDAL